MTRRAAIVSPLRTPVGKFLGTLAPMDAGQLGAVILKALIERTGIDPERIDDVVFSQGYGNGEAPCIGHWSWLAAGLPLEGAGLRYQTAADAMRGDVPTCAPTESIGAVRQRETELPEPRPFRLAA